MVEALGYALVVCVLVLLVVALLTLVLRFLSARLGIPTDVSALIQNVMWIVAVIVCVVVLARALLGGVF